MTRRRAVSAEERTLFETAFRETIPLVPPKAKAAKPDAAKAGPQPKPPKYSGLDGNTADRLRKGDLKPQASLDLHGLTESAAHRALATFLRGACARGLRLVIVVTGKGAKPAAPDEPFDLEKESRRRGVLRTMTPRWLGEPDLAPFIADVRSAHRSHGGSGALYVYLRKKER
ncbi:MAG TPA: Smr/MutS family protein [Rhizomicrobium sp.]